MDKFSQLLYNDIILHLTNPNRDERSLENINFEKFEIQAMQLYKTYTNYELPMYLRISKSSRFRKTRLIPFQQQNNPYSTYKIGKLISQGAWNHVHKIYNNNNKVIKFTGAIDEVNIKFSTLFLIADL